jgi:hypothetical protein
MSKMKNDLRHIHRTHQPDKSKNYSKNHYGMSFNHTPVKHRNKYKFQSENSTIEGGMFSSKEGRQQINKSSSDVMKMTPSRVDDVSINSNDIYVQK